MNWLVDGEGLDPSRSVNVNTLEKTDLVPVFDTERMET
jgi:hypothetical protein